MTQSYIHQHKEHKTYESLKNKHKEKLILRKVIQLKID